MRVLISILLVLLSATTLVAQDISANNEIDNIIKRLQANKPNQGKVVVKQEIGRASCRERV